MACLINSDTSDGLKFTSDTSGEIKLQSAGTDIVSVTANGIDVTGDFTIADKIIHSGDTNTAIRFPLADTVTVETAGTERMRIASDGKIAVGTTDTGFASGVGVKIRPGLDGSIATVDSASTSASTSLIMYSTGASAYRFYVNWAGTIYATSTSITGISDERLKENIVDLDEGLDTVMSLKPRKFDWKNGKGKNIKGDRGFIAQEFETVLPDLTEELKDEVPDGEAPYKGVNLNLIPILVKAIQELKTENDTLKSQLSALETRIQALENA